MIYDRFRRQNNRPSTEDPSDFDGGRRSTHGGSFVEFKSKHRKWSAEKAWSAKKRKKIVWAELNLGEKK